jgi:hypothetical protein
MMTKRERILRTLHFAESDCVPLLGGWIIDDRHQQAIAGCTEEVYWQNPARCAIQAHRVLGVDGMIMVNVPDAPGAYRGNLTKDSFESYKQRFKGPEDVLAYVRSQPSSEEAVSRFDADGWREELRSQILVKQRIMGDVVYLPTLWDVVHPGFEWYNVFGYENYLLFMHLYPEAAGKFFESMVGVARRKAEIVVGLYEELDVVPLTLIGTDICGGGGPVISPAFLRELYFPHVRRSIEPLREAGIRTVWHSDGDIRPIVDIILSAGVSGLQGFQEEYGVDIADVAKYRTLDGEKLTIFAGPSVTTTLPYGTVDDVRRDLERIIDTLADECALFILPANNVLPDCPVENVVVMHSHAIEYGRKKRSRG